MTKERNARENKGESGDEKIENGSSNTTPIIMSRKEALALGLTKYWTGKPCSKGHEAFRWTTRHACSECAKKAVKKNSRTSNARRLKLLNAAKYRCSKRGTEFNLCLDDVHIPEHCPVLGIPIESGGGGGFRPNSPSIDRIDPSKGYTPDNIRIISWRANKLKSDASVEEIEAVLAYMKGEV